VAPFQMTLEDKDSPTGARLTAASFWRLMWTIRAGRERWQSIASIPSDLRKRDDV
jgi:hypothetical protein